MTEIHEIPTEDLEWALGLVRDPRFSFPVYSQGTTTKTGRHLSKEGDFSLKEITTEMERRTAPEQFTMETLRDFAREFDPGSKLLKPTIPKIRLDQVTLHTHMQTGRSLGELIDD